MTFEERVAALAFLGRSPRVRAFIVLVALNGGYCVRRQYATFAHIAQGRLTTNVLNGLVTAGLMERTDYQRRGWLYHLTARSVYAALNVPGHSNRQLTPSFVARQLMLLDFVLSQPNAMWLATEAEQVEFFSEHLGVVPAALPRQRPRAGSKGSAEMRRPVSPNTLVFLEPNEPRVIHFAVLALDSSGSGTERFLYQHRALLDRLEAWSLHAACPERHFGLGPSRAAFGRTVAAVRRRGDGAIALDPELARYFRTRYAIDLKTIGGVSVGDLEHFREARARFIGPDVERHYTEWCKRARALGEPEASEVSPGPSWSTAQFVPHELPFWYRQFGDLPGEC
jgi:hypothetical protein